MPRVITTLQAMSHPTVVATINTLAEMSQRLQDENDELKKPWVGLTPDEVMAIGRELGLTCKLGGNPNIDFDYAQAIEAKLKEKNT